MLKGFGDIGFSLVLFLVNFNKVTLPLLDIHDYLVSSTKEL